MVGSLWCSGICGEVCRGLEECKMLVGCDGDDIVWSYVVNSEYVNIGVGLVGLVVIVVNVVESVYDCCVFFFLGWFLSSGVCVFFVVWWEIGN